jgi:hypothetical protein
MNTKMNKETGFVNIPNLVPSESGKIRQVLRHTDRAAGPVTHPPVGWMKIFPLVFIDQGDQACPTRFSLL